MSKYHLHSEQEATRVINLYEKVNSGELRDIKELAPHILVRVNKAPLTPFLGKSLGGKFAIVSSDYKSIFYAGMAFNFNHPDENGVGWVVDEIIQISKYK